MTEHLQPHLRELARHLNLEPRRAREILAEIQVHLEDRVRELVGHGYPLPEAVNRAVAELGHPRNLAHAFYAVHSRAGLKETLLAVLPHLLFAALFAFHLWVVSAWVVLVLIAATMVSVVAWKQGRPRWAYPWLGYCLVPPVVAWFLSLLNLSGGVWATLRGEERALPLWAYSAMFAYLWLGGWAVWQIWRRMNQQEWLYPSISLLPFPLLTSWLLFFYQHGGPWAYDAPLLLGVDGVTAFGFLALAVLTALFFRTGNRGMRVALMLFGTPVLLLVTASGYGDNPMSAGVLAFSSLSVGLLLLPAVGSTLGHRNEGGIR